MKLFDFHCHIFPKKIAGKAAKRFEDWKRGELMRQKVFDFHCHIFPEKIAPKAVANIGAFYHLEMTKKGTVDDLVTLYQEYGIDNMLVHSTATREQQVEHINDFIIEEVRKHKELIGFGTMHPDYKNKEQEFQRILECGLKGLKIHPDFQEVNIDDKRMYPIYEMVGDKVPILFHVGDKVKDFSHPRRLLKVMNDFPKLRPVAAHMGGYSVWDEALELFKGRQVWFDTCSSFAFLTNQKIEKIMKTHGVEKILFASDYPMWDAKKEYERLLTLDLTQSQLEDILYNNGMRLLSLI